MFNVGPVVSQALSWTVHEFCTSCMVRCAAVHGSQSSSHQFSKIFFNLPSPAEKLEAAHFSLHIPLGVSFVVEEVSSKFLSVCRLATSAKHCNTWANQENERMINRFKKEPSSTQLKIFRIVAIPSIFPILSLCWKSKQKKINNFSPVN